MVLTETYTLKAPALIVNDEKNIDYKEIVITHTHTYTHREKHPWQEKKIYKDAAPQSSMLTNQATATSFKILHTASQMLRIQEIVKAYLLNWINMGFHGAILFIFINAAINDILTLKFIINLDAYLFLWLQLIYYLNNKNEAQHPHPDLLSASFFLLWRQFRTHKNEEVRHYSWSQRLLQFWKST